MDKIKELVSSYKLPIALTLLGVVLLGGGVTSSFSQLMPKPLQAHDLPQSSIVSAENITKAITIDVAGAVKNPGVYQLDIDARTADAIKSAGGFNDKVNKVFVAKQLNLASKVSDGMKLYIPFEGEQVASASAISSLSSPSIAKANASSETKININTDSEAELDKLPGVGAVTAGKIIKLRPYTSPAELLSKKAVSKSVYEKVKDLIEI